MKKLLFSSFSILQGGVRMGLLLLLLVANVSAIYSADIQVDGIWYDFGNIESVDFSAQGYTRAEEVSSYEGTNFSVAFEASNGTHSATYYHPGIRVYGRGSFIVTSESTITKIVIESGSSTTYNDIYANIGTFSDDTWSGTSNSVTFTFSGTSGYRSIEKLTVVTTPGGTASVTYRGSAYDSYNGEYSSSITIPKTVTYNDTTYNVTSIGENAFRNCSGLTSVSIPNSVTSIGDQAFYGCSSLTSVTIPNGVTSIGYSAFEGCSSLTTITIPNSVTSIEAWAFYGCSSLTSPVYNAHLFAYMPTSYSGAYTIPEGIEQIACYAFNCSSLTSVTIPNSVTRIGRNAFQGCSSLTSVTIGNSVEDIGYQAFDGCSSLTSVAIPNSVTSIGYWAFFRCSSLTSVTIGNSVTSIGEGAFYKCSSLTSVTIGNSVTSIGDEAFSSCSSLISINIPNSVTSIGDYAFSSCSSLTSVTIPNSVTSIGEQAFFGCSSLSSVAIGNGVTHINKSIFDGCTGLNLLRLGTGIQSIAADAFSDCTKLYDIYCLAAEPPTGYTSSFANYNAFLHVPCESQRLYMLDVLFGEFKYIECIASDEVTTDDIVITPGLTDVTIIWPSEDYADTYTIIIKKGDEVFCTLTFNAEGQLLNIAFAPGRNGNHPVQYAEQAGKGYRFTVTGLEEATDYTYDITIKDASNKTINSHSGKFTTQSTTAVDNITTNNANIQKIIRDGQFIIVRDGVEYNAVGQEM